jgi:hypothetical protein
MHFALMLELMGCARLWGLRILFQRFQVFDSGHGPTAIPGQARRMKRLWLSPTILVLLGLMSPLAPASAVDSVQVKKLFQNPPREYSTGPLRVWNDMLTE